MRTSETRSGCDDEAPKKTSSGKRTAAGEKKKEACRAEKKAPEKAAGKTRAEQKPRKAPGTDEKKPEKETEGLKEKKEKRRKPKFYSEIPNTGYTQDYLSVIEDIRGGMIITNRHHYVYIMEIFPANFAEKPMYEKQRIMSAFRRFPKAAPINGHLYMTSEITNVRVLLDRIMTACPSSRGATIRKLRNDYIRTIKSLSMEETLTYRYYYIFEYEGKSGIRADDIQSIYREMMLTKATLKNIMYECGNMVADPENENLYTLDILYKFFNRSSYKSEPIMSRIMRINADCKKAGVEPTVRDYIAPRGLVLNYSPEMMMMDGIYYTYLALEDRAYPDYLEAGWLSDLQCTRQMDIHFFTHRQPGDSTRKSLKKKNFWTKQFAKDIQSENKREETAVKIGNTADIIRQMDNGDELDDCCTVLVLYRSDPQELMDTRDQLYRLLNNAGQRGMPLEKCYADTEEYFYMTFPLIQFQNSIFKRNWRNFTSTAFETVYCMTQYNCYDDSDKATVWGREENGTLVAVNRFNKNLHVNPHAVLIGTSGSGKTVTQMALGRRDIIMGVKAYYILPFKAFEHMDNIKASKGTYISFGPDSTDTYNPLELYPEIENTDPQDFSDDAPKQTKSILARKITMLCTWIRILAVSDQSGKYVLTTLEKNRISNILYKLYADFGITKDNESIWTDETHTKKKVMPIMGYLYKRMLEDERVAVFADLLVPFVSGIFKNFNRQTNLDLHNDLIVCDVDVDDIGDELHPAVMYLAFTCLSDLIKTSPGVYQSLYLDEVWRMMVSDVIGKIIEEQIRILRGYGGSVVCGSQQIKEFTENRYGQAVIANSAIKILMRMEDDELERVAGHIHLDNSDRAYLKKAKQGDMLIICNGSRTRCHMNLSIDELIDYTSDPKDKRKLLRRREEQKLLPSR